MSTSNYTSYGTYARGKLERRVKKMNGKFVHYSPPKVLTAAPVNNRTQTVCTLLHDAVLRGSLAELQEILSKETARKKLVLCKDAAGVGLLHKAVYYDFQDIVNWLSSNYPATLNQKDSAGRRALEYAARGAGGVARPTLPALAAEMPRENTTARSNPDLVIKPSNIRIWCHDRDLGRLQRVVWAGQGARLLTEVSSQGVVKRFLEAVPYIMNTIRELHSAVVNDDEAGVRNLTEAPVPRLILSSRDAHNLTLLHKAAGLGHLEILEYMAEKWPEGLNAVDDEGRTALHYAASLRGDHQTYETLIKLGAEEGVLDNKLKTAGYYLNRPTELDRTYLTMIPDAPRTPSNSYPSSWDWKLLDIDNVTNYFRKVKKSKANNENNNNDSLTDNSITEVNTTSGMVSSNTQDDLAELHENEENEALSGGEAAETSEIEPINDSKMNDEPIHDNNNNSNPFETDIVNLKNSEAKVIDHKRLEQESLIRSNENNINTEETPFIPLSELPNSGEELSDAKAENTNPETNNLEETNLSPTNVVKEHDANDDIMDRNDDDINIETEKQISSIENEKSENTGEYDGKTVVTEQNEENNKSLENEHNEDENSDTIKIAKTEKKLDFEENNIPNELESTKENVRVEESAHKEENYQSDQNIHSEENTHSEENAAEKGIAHHDDDKNINNEENNQNEKIIQNENIQSEGNIHNHSSNHEVVDADTTIKHDHSSNEDNIAETTNISINNNADVNEESPNVKNESENKTENEIITDTHDENEADKKVESQDKDIEEDQNKYEDEKFEFSDSEVYEERGEEQRETQLQENGKTPSHDEKGTLEDGDVKHEDGGIANDTKSEYGDSNLRSTAEALDTGSAKRGSSVSNGRNTHESLIEGLVNAEAEVTSLDAARIDEQDMDHNDYNAFNKEDKEVDQLIKSANMEQLAALVLNGEGRRLLNRTSSNTELQAFLDNVPTYMNKIKRVHIAAREGNIRDLQAALDRRKFAIARDPISPNGATPLHVATIFGRTNIIKYLGGRFPETLSAVDFEGRTALHYASVIPDNGHYYNLLQHLGANSKDSDDNGKSAENYWEDSSLLSLKELLKDFGVDETIDMLNDKVPSDVVSSRRDLDDPELLATLERCYKLLADARLRSSTSQAPPSASSNRGPPVSFLGRFLRRTIFERIKYRVTKLNHNFFDVIWPAVKKLPDSKNIIEIVEEDFTGGVTAPDYYVYAVFDEFLQPFVKDLHNLNIYSDLHAHPQSSYIRKKSDKEPERYLEMNVDPGNKLVLSGTIECSRNLQDFELPLNLGTGQLEKVERIITSILMNDNNKRGNSYQKSKTGKKRGTYYTLNEVLENPSEIRAMLAARGMLIPLCDKSEIDDEERLHGKHWPYGRGVYMNESHSLAVWINVHEHVRVVTSTPTNDPAEIGLPYSRLASVMMCLHDKLSFKWDAKLGHLSCRPSFLGSAIHFTLTVHFPSLAKEPENLKHLCSVRGLQYRETMSPEIVRIGNYQCLSLSEDQIFADFSTAASNLLHLEKDLVMQSSGHIAAMLTNIFKRKRSSLIEPVTPEL